MFTICSLIGSFVFIHRYLLRPRYLRDVSAVDMKTSVLGCVVDFPVGIAPTGSHKMAHKDGEEATARGRCASLSL